MQQKLLKRLRRMLDFGGLRANGCILGIIVLLAASSENVAGGFKPKIFKLAKFRLENGLILNEAQFVYATFGKLNKEKTNAVVLPSHYRASHDGYNYLILGPGACLDPKKDFIILTNTFGNGISSSPSNTPPPQNGPKFPAISIRDNVNAMHQLISREFGIKKLKAVIGFSMGGQQAYQWAVSHPDSMDAIVVICATAKEYPFGIARLESAKGALMADPAFANGNFKKPPERGLRAFGLHWMPWLFSQEWWRREAYRLQGLTLQQRIKRFELSFLSSDANDLICQANTWQNHDVGDTPKFNGDLKKALRSIKARVLCMPCDTDLYFRLADAKNESRFIPDAEFIPIRSVWGHTAGGGSNPTDTRFVNRTIMRFLSE